jgi:hypothetical protein
MIKLTLLFLIILLLIIGCSTEPEKDKFAYSIIKIDSLKHVSNMSLHDTLKIKLYGLISYDECSSFSHFEDKKQSLQLDLTVWSKRSNSTICYQMLVFVTGKEYKTTVTQKGLYKIIIHQPDKSILKDSLIIN